MTKPETCETDDYSSDWIECWNCGGHGRTAGCFEDTCSCTGDESDPDGCCAPKRCDVCRGGGGWEHPEHSPAKQEDARG